jgi:uncharacterized protein (UPF0335 family)
MKLGQVIGMIRYVERLEAERDDLRAKLKSGCDEGGVRRYIERIDQINSDIANICSADVAAESADLFVSDPSRG